MLIDDAANADAVMTQPDGTITDGVPGTVSINCRVRCFEYTKQGFNEFGQVQYGRVFLVAPLASTPVLPGTITVQGKTYTMASVKPYRSHSGVLYGYRIAVSGGE